MLPGTTELLIIMELMATSLSDLVSTWKLLSQHTAHAKGYWVVHACACHLVHDMSSISPPTLQSCCTIQNPNTVSCVGFCHLSCRIV